MGFTTRTNVLAVIIYRTNRYNHIYPPLGLPRPRLSSSLSVPITRPPSSSSILLPVRTSYHMSTPQSSSVATDPLNPQRSPPVLFQVLISYHLSFPDPSPHQLPPPVLLPGHQLTFPSDSPSTKPLFSRPSSSNTRRRLAVPVSVSSPSRRFLRFQQ